MNRRLALGVAVLAAATAIGSLVLGRGTRDEAPDRPLAAPTGSAEGRDGGAGLATPSRSVAVAPRAAGRCRLEGQVLRAREPSRAEIEVRWSAAPAYLAADARAYFVGASRDADAPVVWRGHAADDGRFAAEDLPAGRWDVTAVAADGARGERAVLAAVDGVREVVTLTLLAARETLRGQVLGDDGRPAACRILAAGRPVDVRADGTFEVVGLCAGPCDLAAEAPDGTQVRAVVQLPRSTLVTLRLPRADGERAVRVLASPGATPIEGAEVYVLGRRGPVARTDGDGRARVPFGGHGPFRFAAEGYATVAVSAGRGEATEPWEVRLRKAARIVGRVHSAADGRGLAGVLVEASAGDFRASEPAASAVSGADGSYVLDDLVPGPWTVVARGRSLIVRGLASMPADDHFGSIRRERLECDPLLVDVPPGTTTLDLEMVPGAVLRGRVLDAVGSPVPGAEVLVYAPRAPYISSVPEPVYWERYATATDSDGRYELAALVAGRLYDVQASASGSGTRVAVRVRDDGSPAVVDLRLPAAFGFDVRVVDDGSGLGQAGALVGVSGPYGGEASLEAVTGEDGWARLGPVPGSVEKVFARRHRGGSKAEQAVDLSKGAPTAPVVVRLPASSPDEEAPVTEAASAAWLADGAELSRHVAPVRRERHRSLRPARGGAPFSVTVLDAEGSPVPSADLVWWDSGDRHGAEARVDDGSVRFAVPESVAQRLWVLVRNAQDRDGVALPVGPARAGPLDVRTGHAELRLPAERTIRGRVVGPDGRGVRGIRLHAVPLDWASFATRTFTSSYPEAHTDASGAFHIRGLASGPHHLVFDVPPEFAPVPPSVHESGERDLELRLRPGEVVSLRMIDPEGRPVVGASVFVSGVPYRAQPLPQDLWSGPRRGGESGADGIVRLAGMSREVPCGLEAQPPADREDLAPLELDAWVPASGDVAFPGLSVVRGVVSSPDGAPIPRAHIEVLRGSTWERLGRAGPDGGFVVRVPTIGGARIEGVVYEVERGDPDGIYWGERTAYRSEPVDVEAGASGVVLVVDRGVELAVRVSYPGARVGWGPGTTHDGVLLDEADAASGRAWERAAGSVRVGDLYRFPQLRADRTYTFWLAPDLAGFYVLATGLRPVRGAEAVTLQAVKGRPVTGRIVGLADVGRTLVSATQGVVPVYVESEPDGRFTFPGLPEGEWRLRADVRRDGRVWTGQAVVGAGGDVDLRLELEPAK